METKKITIDMTESQEFMPDMVKFCSTISVVSKKYDTVIAECKNKSVILSEKFENLKKLKVKVSSNMINVTQNRTQKNGNWVDDGFKCTQQFEIISKNEPKLLSAILSILECDETNSFSANFFISNPSKHSNLLIKKAIENARSKATIMAETLNKKLGDVLEINYHSSYGHSPQVLRCSVSNRSNDEFVNSLSPSPVVLSESVNISFEIV